MRLKSTGFPSWPGLVPKGAATKMWRCERPPEVGVGLGETWRDAPISSDAGQVCSVYRYPPRFLYFANRGIHEGEGRLYSR